MSTVAIIDYGLCNLDSVRRAVQECGGNPIITDQHKDIEIASHIILPGVGAFPEAMNNIKKRSLDLILYEQVVEKQIPMLGICLGMQLLATFSYEVKETKGLGFVPGTIKLIEPYGEDTRIPHIGWNEVHPIHDSPLFNGIPDNKDFYFVHSYIFCPENFSDTLATTPYGHGFVSAVQQNLIFGVQFHPEKSQRFGFNLLGNFLGI